jgi:hypothetical protein
MPRASLGVFCAFPLVWCPVYLSPATRRTTPIRLPQVWRPAPVGEPEDTLPDRGREEQPGKRPALRRDGAGEDADQTSRATRITLRPSILSRLRACAQAQARTRLSAGDRRRRSELVH